MIIATDLDRTLLPNGNEPYDNTLPLLFSLLKGLEQVTLVYVSGRNYDLLHDAVDSYGVEFPDYFVGETGTVMYNNVGDKRSHLEEYGKWNVYLGTHAPRWDRTVLRSEIEVHPTLSNLLEPQEGWKAGNNYKLSYYFSVDHAAEEVEEACEGILTNYKIKGHVVTSVDPLQNKGLVDILPNAATKENALEFLRQELNEEKADVFYAGDSGNDILPLTAGYNSVIVKNARKSVKEEVAKTMKEHHRSNHLFIAKGNDKYGLNGNYSSGIIEGLLHFGLIDKEDIDEIRND